MLKATGRVGYRLDSYDSGAKAILLKRFRFLNGARTDTFFKIVFLFKKNYRVLFYFAGACVCGAGRAVLQGAWS